MDKSERIVKELLASAEVQINGPNPWDLQVLDERFYKDMLTRGSLGLGEAYIHKWIDCEQLDQFLYRLVKARIDEKIRKNFFVMAYIAKSRLLNLQSLSRASEVSQYHYDLSNEFYEYMLGESMAYTCAYWKNTRYTDPKSLDAAQYRKFDLVCRKLHLKEGERVLELGCGFGSFAKYAAENYGCHMVSVNISDEQVKYARQLCKGLPVDIFHCDYRDHRIYNPKGKKFDKIVSIGMCEHVGPKNYRRLFRVAHNQLKDDGWFLLHTIGSHVSLSACEPFTHKYIFPNSVLPSIKQLGRASEGLFVMEDLHNFIKSYYYTIKGWYQNFVDNWEAIQKLDPGKFDETFFRIWSFYLLAAKAFSGLRANTLWQIVFSKREMQMEYEAVR